MVPLSITAQTAYAELLEQLMTLDAHRSIGQAPGTFVEKSVRDRAYWYFQYASPGRAVQQVYIGPRTKELDAIVTKFRSEREGHRGDRERIATLCAMLRASGAATTDTASARLIGALADAGVFKLGGVVVGTHAFVTLGNMLGLVWTGQHARTEDVDIAATRTIEVALPDLQADVPRALDGLKMGFLPVPSLSSKHPSTSFRVRQQALRLDLVTPAKQERDVPVRIGRFNAAAAPVRYLEFALEDVQPAAIIDGGGVLVRVPSPSRFAVLKLLVAQDRPPAFQSKARKDLAQAAALIGALAATRPGEFESTVTLARRRGRRWSQALDRACALTESQYPQMTRHLR